MRLVELPGFTTGSLLLLNIDQMRAAAADPSDPDLTVIDMGTMGDDWDYTLRIRYSEFKKRLGLLKETTP